MHLVKLCFCFVLFFAFVLTYFLLDFLFCMGFLGDSVVKNHLSMQETWAWSLAQEDPLEKEMATHFSILLSGKSHRLVG